MINEILQNFVPGLIKHCENMIFTFNVTGFLFIIVFKTRNIIGLLSLKENLIGHMVSEWNVVNLSLHVCVFMLASVFLLHVSFVSIGYNLFVSW